MPKRNNFKSPQQVWESISSVTVNFVERLFFTIGVTVASHPWRTIITTLVFVILSCIGLLRFHTEKNPMKLWVPPDSDFIQDTEWYIDRFGTGVRLQKVIVTADNVLEPQVLQTIHSLNEKVMNIQVSHNNKLFNLSDLCYKTPVVDIFSSEEDSRSAESSVNITTASKSNTEKDYSDQYLWISENIYCSFFHDLQQTCLQLNILDLWNNDLNLLRNISQVDIIKSVNTIKINPVNGHPVDFTKLLGGVKYGPNGNIVSAKSVLLTWYTYVNMTAVDLDEVGNLVGTEDWVSVPLALWEKKFLDLMSAFSKNSSDIKVYYEAGRSFGDISGESMFHDLDKLFLGIILMFIYIQFALSRCNWLEIRLTLGSVGLLCVGLAYISAVSWCSILGISFGPVHSSLPFLLMGLGIDDMFVMNACWQTLSPSSSKQNLPIKIGSMLKHAGVSIVITSFTDIVALLIGAITILPSLKSFCIYAAVGVFFIFCYSVTFYVAVFTLDIKRIESNRNSILFCYQHKNPIQISAEKSIFQKILAWFYEKVLFTIPGKTITIIFTLVMTGFSIQAILLLEQRFDPKWFIPDNTYYKQFLDFHEYYYPEEGHKAMIFLGDLNYRYDFDKLYNMVQEIKNESYINSVEDWVEDFYKYVLKNYEVNLKNTSDVTDDQFNQYLNRFLFSSIGGFYQTNFRFPNTLECGNPSTQILASTISFEFNRFLGPEEYIPAMHHIKHLVESTRIATGDGYRSVWAKAFANWVTDEVIAIEVERNIELALLCVMICTVILITNLQICFWIFMCVLLTIVNVLGCMQRWGMTVDIVCCIGLELAIGLCVDYAAHVGHTFLTVSEGNRNDRALQTVTSIGSAVLLGGGSTLLSLSLLSMSKAYTFQSFFKIFLLVIIFGLFCGLIFMPVVLSLIGPSAYKHHEVEDDNMKPEVMELNGKHEVPLNDINDEITSK